MAVFSKVAMTTLGLNLYAKVQAGAALNFTRMQIGSGQLPAGNDPAAQTALITPIAYFAINSISPNLNTAHIKGIFENTLISVSTYTCELGLFATDPTLGEILYAYANALTQGDTIPPYTSGPLSKQYQLNAAIGNSTSTTATIPAGTYIPVSDKGIASGVATLDTNTLVPLVQIPVLPATKLANGAATDTVIGNRTIDDTIVAAAGTDTPTGLWSKLANMIKGITGKANWYTPPVVSMETLNTTTPKVSTANVTYYVLKTGSDSNTGLTNTAGGAFLTIAKAVSMIPQIVNHTYVVSVGIGIYAEAVALSGFSGRGSINIVGGVSFADAANYVVTSIFMGNSTITMQLNFFQAMQTGGSSFQANGCPKVVIIGCDAGAGAAPYGFALYTSSAQLVGCGGSNKSNGVVYANSNSWVALRDWNGGTGNPYGAVSDYCSIIIPVGAQPPNPSGPNGGIINPWGDSTTASRSAVQVFSNTTQSILAGTTTKVILGSGVYDNLGEFTASRFTAKKAGIYLISGIMSVSGLTAGTSNLIVFIYKNGTNVAHNPLITIVSSTGVNFSFTDSLALVAGDYVELYIQTSTTSTVNGNTYFQIMQGA
jgi:hypothetical protein